MKNFISLLVLSCFISCSDDHTSSNKYQSTYSIEEAMANSKDVEYLYLNNQQLTELPNDIGNLENLVQLHLNKNYIALLPESLGDLHNLQFFLLIKMN